MTKRRRHLLLIVAACVLVAAGAAWALSALLTPAPALSWPPAGARLTQAASGLDQIDLDMAFDPVTNALSVKQTLRLANRTGVTQRQAVLRAYPNAFQSEEFSPAATDELYDACYPDGFSEGRLTIATVRGQFTQGEEFSPSYAYTDEAQTVLAISLPGDWAADQTLTLSVAYAVRIPNAAYRFGVNGGIWALGNAVLIPAPFREGEYQTPVYESIGDPFISECANYTARVTVPEQYEVAATGAARTQTVENGRRTITLDAPAVREFALCLSENYRLAETMRDGVRLRAYALSDSRARTMLELAGQALSCYSARYGAYPYPALTLCETDFPFGGMEYPMLEMISADRLDAGGEALEQVVAHETAHQWWSVVVGSDGFYQAWQDEALCEFSVLDYWETRYGKDARDAMQFSQADAAMRVTVPQGVTPGSPVDYFGDLPEYRLVVYDRGLAAMCALDTALNGGLDGFLARYDDAYGFRLATRQDFETLLAAFTGEDWSPLLSDYLDTYLNN